MEKIPTPPDGFMDIELPEGFFKSDNLLDEVMLTKLEYHQS